jgi:hypothetical protein
MPRHECGECGLSEYVTPSRKPVEEFAIGHIRVCTAAQ